MQSSLIITADWERLDEGPLEERACFAALGVLGNNHWMTEGHDSYVNRVRSAPLLSAYHLAEWFAWNWWRLRWEPRSRAPDWAFAHRMATIGEGYVWPNITIISDGDWTALIARPTTDRAETAFRYISDRSVIMPSPVFENAVDQFANQVLGQLQAESVQNTNLQRLWSELGTERRDRDAARRRKLEALLGCEPDESDATIIERLIHDAQLFGERAVEELAADRAQGGGLLAADDLRQLANINGFDASPRDAIRLAPGGLPLPRDVKAWQLGADAARAARERNGLGDGPIDNKRLAELAGTTAGALTDTRHGPRISFALDHNETQSRIVLRSRWPTGRRFELARLLGERIVASPQGRLHAATRAYTYRQKMQRSFAAELLSPFEVVDQMLAGDYSGEAQQDVAEQFQVSELTIRTLLVNHRRLEREELDEDLVAA
ncbi:hypothetical protein [Rhodopila sp.]|uniref:hypothetical protein n=1 Tax=Rhodopila sp. TaxID=2480087 RepID=UPI003D108170